MKKFFALLNVSFRGMLLSANPSSKAKRKAASGVGFLALMCVLMLYLGGVYSFAFGAILAPLGRLDLLLALMGLMDVAMCFFFGVMSSSGFVFGGKDNDILFSMPVSAFSVLLSKVLALYLENLAFTLFLLLPAGAACIYFGGFGAAFVLLLVAAAVLLPLLPTALCLLLGFLFSLLQTRVRHRALVTNLLYILFLAAVMVLSFGMSFSMSSGDPSIAGSLDAATGWALPVVWMAKALTVLSLGWMLAFALTCVGSFLLVVWVFSLFYKRILTHLTSVQVRHDYKLTALKSGSAFSALYRKELRRIFGTPVYLMNTGVGALLLLGGGIYAFVSGGDISAVLSQLPPQISGMIPAALALVLCFCVTLSSSTSACISLEGNRLWILREAPVSVDTIFFAKILAGLTLMLPAVLIGAPLGAYGCGLSLTDALVLILLGVAATFFTVLEGLVLNLIWPKLDAVNDTVVVKRSMSVSVQVFGSFGLLAAGAGLYYLLSKPLGPTGALACLAALLALLSLLFAALLRGWGRRSFEALCG